MTRRQVLRFDELWAAPKGDSETVKQFRRGYFLRVRLGGSMCGRARRTPEAHVLQLSVIKRMLARLAALGVGAAQGGTRDGQAVLRWVKSRAVV